MYICSMKNNLITEIRANKFFDTSKNIASDILPSDIIFKGYETNTISPMLAFTYDPLKKAYNSFDLKDLELEGKEIAIQPKLDGIRCIAVINENSCILYYRSGERISNLEHIEYGLKAIFNLLKENNETEIIIDGELLLLDYSFNKLNGLLNKKNKTELHNTVTYNVFDIIQNKCFIERNLSKGLFNWINIKPVPTEYIIASEQLLKEKLNEYVSQGYEGLMIRELGVIYEGRRTTKLLKYKNWIDDEFEIISINKEDIRDIAGSFTVKNKDGQTFNCSLSFTLKKRAELLNNKSKYIGKFVNVKFFEYSENNIPRFPVAKYFRNDMDQPHRRN